MLYPKLIHVMINTLQLEIDLERSIHRTGDVWHVLLESLGRYTRYGYRCKVF